MSRQWATSLAIWLLAAAPALAQAPAANPEAEARVDAMVETAREKYGPPRPRPCHLQPHAADEIVVCAQDRSQYRVAPSSEVDPLGKEALNDGVPHAPNFNKLPSCADPRSNCFGYAPPPIYIIDLKAIPEAPEGSDADKIAKGEMAPG